MKKCKVAVIGTGGIANGMHLPILKEQSNVEIVALCDRVKERADTTAQKFGVSKVYYAYDEMLKTEGNEIEAVFVLTEPDALFRAAVECLKYGKHVLIEKPMGVTSFQANSLRGHAIEQKKLLHVAYNRRFVPLVVEMVKQMREITEINQVCGYFYKNSSAGFYGGSGSAFIYDVVHAIDLIRHIAGGDENVTNVSTMESFDPELGIACGWHSTMRFKNGIDGVIGSSYRSGGRVHRFEIHGVGASAWINLGFGDESCDGKIICAGKSFSIISAPANSKNQYEYDGIKIAGSNKYRDYCGYRDEDIHFINKVLENPTETDIARLNEDYSSMRLAEILLEGRVKS